jgi:small conductance mechanosensitive channel
VFSIAQLHDAEGLARTAADVAFNVAVAIAIFFAGKWLAQVLIKLLRIGFRRGKVDETLADFLANVLYGLALTVVVIAAARTLGVDTTSAAAVLGGAALAIGLSLQNQLSSFAAGVIIILFRPFSKGDYVEVGGVKGTVEEIKIVSTQLRTLDNKRVVVPNASVTTNVITNYTALGSRRVELVYVIAHGAEIEHARRVVLGVLKAEQRVLETPEPSVRVRDIDTIGVQLDVWGWVRSDDLVDARALLLETIKLRLDAEGIEVPAPDGRVRVPRT